MLTGEEIRFREFLRDKGLQFTAERRLILEEVFRRHEHFEAEDIIEGLHSRGRRVSRASVYRALPLLVGSGLLRQVYSDEKHGHYEHTYGHDHHDHLICSRCGRTMEFSEPAIEQLQEAICSEFGFLPASHELEIVGTCASCRRADAQ